MKIKECRITEGAEEKRLTAVNKQVNEDKRVPDYRRSGRKSLYFGKQAGG